VLTFPAWGTAVGKQTIRRCPPFKKFQNFLVAETTVGNISRQEAVSMIPPLLMDIYPHHTVLDMCAAPGSKTAQLVEMIHNREESAVEAAAAEPGEECRVSEGEVGGRATGLVIANDADYKRSHMLIHQTKRLNSPNLIVTNHDATMFPSLLTSPEKEGAQKQYLKFDRILADVPCTGDGTARKNYSVWKDWNPHSAFNLHAIQIRILVRGLQMLKVGGRLVYSTCSMNPIENEAVVQAAIDRCGGLDKVEIVDVSHRLPELKRKPGLKGGWKVMDKDRTWYTSFDEVLRDDSDRETRVGRITRSMFPTEGGKFEDDPTRIPLERCVRIYPHLQDTGGFFIAVLKKKQEIRAIKPEDTKQQRVATLKAEQSVLDSSSTSHEDVVAEGALTPMEEQTSVMEESITNIGESVAPSTLVPAGKTTPSPPPSPGKRKLESPIPAPALKKLKADNILSTSTPRLESGSVTTTLGGSSTAKGKGPPQEEPFKYLPPNHSVLKQIDEFYGLSSRFPRTCFMVRNAEALPTRAIYFTSHLAKLVLEANEGRGVKFVHCGVKAFMKQDIQSPEVCPWRIQSEGLGIVAPWIGGSRVIHAKKRDTVHALLQELFPKVNDPADAAKEKTTETPKDKTISEIESQVRNISMGCCVLKVEKAEGEFTENMILPLWKSRYSCNLMLPKEERK
jgi:multisite-specific tRNA:(cytosine-C5)-methyltransferase